LPRPLSRDSTAPPSSRSTLLVSATHPRLTDPAGSPTCALARLQVARKIDFNDPDVLLYVRIFYVGVQALTLGIYYYVTLKVRLLALSLGRAWGPSR